MPDHSFKPFGDSETQISIGDLSIENGAAEIAISGALTLRRDKCSLAQARALAAFASDLVKTLEAAGDLPDQAAPPETHLETIMKNPFS